jgi:hypothetical protein
MKPGQGAHRQQDSRISCGRLRASGKPQGDAIFERRLFCFCGRSSLRIPPGVGGNLAEKELKQEQLEIDTPGEILCAEMRAEEYPEDGGLERLRSAAEEQLRLHAGEIAVALGKKALSGDSNSAKFLLAISKEKPRPVRWRPRDGPTEAQRLAAEPQWEEPADSSGDAGDDDLEADD